MPFAIHKDSASVSRISGTPALGVQVETFSTVSFVQQFIRRNRNSELGCRRKKTEENHVYTFTATNKTKRSTQDDGPTKTRVGNHRDKERWS